MHNDLSKHPSLTGGGDCAEHYHLADRSPTHDTGKRIDELKNVVEVLADYTVSYADDYILVDTTAGVVNLTMPLARNGFIVTVLRIAGANNVNVNRSGADTINGGSTISISSSYVPQTFKAVPPTLFAGYVRVA